RTNCRWGSRSAPGPVISPLPQIPGEGQPGGGGAGAGAGGGGAGRGGVGVGGGCWGVVVGLGWCLWFWLFVCCWFVVVFLFGSAGGFSFVCLVLFLGVCCFVGCGGWLFGRGGGWFFCCFFGCGVGCVCCGVFCWVVGGFGLYLRVVGTWVAVYWLSTSHP
ncbi:hypothetical protein, partial [Pseudomonas syringae group genomosp. 7]|uniref:hypothetical protein n=1 Tax=Pseudomonas syringae group genomosp. 7 TaxID=251699 RepID=UPI00376FB4A4